MRDEAGRGEGGWRRSRRDGTVGKHPGEACVGLVNLWKGLGEPRSNPGGTWETLEGGVGNSGKP